MTEHLSPEEIERLSKYQLHGEALLDALAHVEECAQCRDQISSPSKSQILEQLFAEKSDSQLSYDKEALKSTMSPKDADSNWLARLIKRLKNK